MGSKTPVTILQELMTQMGTTPRYDLLYDGTGSQNPVFTYRVYAKNVSATGSGRTKKEAKHEAALAALKCFSLHKIQDSHPSEEPAETVTSHEYKMENNAIGEHHKMCATITTKCDIPIPGKKMVEEKEAQMEKIRSFVSLFNKKKEIENNVGIKTPVTILQELMIKMGTVPKYDLEYDGTGSHIPVFTYRVHANNVSATGSGRTKKEAKHVAALAALECMSLNQTEDSQPPQKPAERLTSLEYKIQENAIGEHDCATNYNPMLEKELVEEKDTRLEKIFHFVSSVNKKKEIENKTLPKSPVTILQELMVQMGTVPKYDLEYDGTGSHNPVFKYRVYAKNVSATGSGRTKKEAKCEAAFAVLECLRLNQIGDSQPPEEPAGTSAAFMQTSGWSGAGLSMGPSEAPYEADDILTAPHPVLVTDSLMRSAARMRTPGWSSESLRMGRSDALHEAENTPSSIQEAGGITSASHPALVKDSLLQSTTRMQTAGWSNAGLRSDTPHEPETSSCASQEDSGRTSGTHPVLVKDSLLQSAARIETPGWPSAGLRMGRSDAPCVADGSPSATEESIGIPSAAQPVLVEDSRFPQVATGVPERSPIHMDSYFLNIDYLTDPSQAEQLPTCGYRRSSARMQIAGWSTESLHTGPSDAPHDADGSLFAIQDDGGIPSTSHPALVKDSLFRSAPRIQTPGWSSAILEMGPCDASHEVAVIPSSTEEAGGIPSSIPEAGGISSATQEAGCIPTAPQEADGIPSATPEAGGNPSTPHPVYLKDSLFRSAARMRTAGLSSAGLRMGSSDAPHMAESSLYATNEDGGSPSAAQPVIVKDSLLGSAVRMQTPGWSREGLHMGPSDAPHAADGSPSASLEAGGITSMPHTILTKDALFQCGSAIHKQTPELSSTSLVMDSSDAPHEADGSPSSTQEAGGISSAAQPVLVKDTLSRSTAHMQTAGWSSAILEMGPRDALHEAEGSLSATQESGGISSAPHPALLKDSVLREAQYQTEIEKIVIDKHHDMCATNVTPMPKNELIDGKESRLEKILTFVSSISKKQEMEEDMGSKTPVSILQEMMTRMGTAPKYDLIFDGSGTHTAEFRYKVYANSVSAIGSGRSKKEAKHEAARVALERLSLSQIEDSQPQEEPVEIVTPYKDKIQENAIGELHDMCATNDIPMPEYELVEEKGAPHEKIFTFVCSVSKQKEIGIGRTKKQAKQLAAYSMMNRLKESLADVLTELKEERHIEPDNDNFEQAIAKYMATIGTPRRKFRLNRSPSKYENFFADVPQDFIDAAVKVLKEIPLPKNENERKELDVDWMLQLTRVMECLNASTMLMPGKHMKNGNKSLFLQINLSTEASFFGVGKSADEAIQDAAYSALLFINIQLRNVKKAHDLA